MDLSIRPRPPKLRVRPTGRDTKGNLVWVCFDEPKTAAALGKTPRLAIKHFAAQRGQAGSGTR